MQDTRAAETHRVAAATRIVPLQVAGLRGIAVGGKQNLGL